MGRKLFGTDGVRGRANDAPMTAETALRLGQAAGRYFTNGGHTHRVLIGKDHLARNLGRPGLPDEKRVGERFERLLGAGREAVLPVGTEEIIAPGDRWGESLTGHFQPIFHLDMHVTPTGRVGASGKEILAFGTPSEAAKVVGLPPDFRLQPAFDLCRRDQQQVVAVLLQQLADRLPIASASAGQQQLQLTPNFAGGCRENVGGLPTGLIDGLAVRSRVQNVMAWRNGGKPIVRGRGSEVGAHGLLDRILAGLSRGTQTSLSA